MVERCSFHDVTDVPDRAGTACAATIARAMVRRKWLSLVEAGFGPMIRIDGRGLA
ncbi:MAG TPA: hypothetical protein VF409_05720 [Sphingomonas sp.]